MDYDFGKLMGSKSEDTDEPDMDDTLGADEDQINSSIDRALATDGDPETRREAFIQAVHGLFDSYKMK